MATTGTDHFRARLNAYQQSTGKSWDEIGAEIGVTRQTVWRWATGKRTPQQWEWESIAAVLGCYEEELFLP